jgi:hypothetical protein
MAGFISRRSLDGDHAEPKFLRRGELREFWITLPLGQKKALS